MREQPLATGILHTANGSYQLTLFRECLVYQPGRVINDMIATDPISKPQAAQLAGRAHHLMVYRRGEWNMNCLRRVLTLNLAGAYMYTPLE